MIDPVTAIGLATTAFNTLKKGIAVGKDLQDMGSQLTQWAGAISDLDFAERQNAKPPWYKTLGGGVQAEAMEIFACLLYTSPSPRDGLLSRMPSSA